LLEPTAAGIAVMVHDLLHAEDLEVPLRTLQRHPSPEQGQRRAVEQATMRFETPPRDQWVAPL
jgi:hypothetical protein